MDMMNCRRDATSVGAAQNPKDLQTLLCSVSVMQYASKIIREPILQNVAIVSIGHHTPSMNFVTQSMDDAEKQGVQVEIVDVRRWLPKNPRHYELVSSEFDGTHPITQRSVIAQEGFPDLMENIIKTQQFAKTKYRVLALKCTSGGHRAFVSSAVAAETLNAIVDKDGQRVYNAIHIPMAWLVKDGHLDRAWKTALEWTWSPWEVMAVPSGELKNKFGYEGAVQRKEAMQNLRLVWELVDVLNKIESHVEQDASDVKQAFSAVGFNEF